jgi:hypothetical protein
MWHTVLITSSEWENFFNLRCPQYSDGVVTFRSKKDFLSSMGSNENTLPDTFWQNINKGQAEIHMMALAEAMWDVMNESTPKQLKVGEYHIPFGDDLDKYNMEYQTETKIKIAVARCARVSYTVVGEEEKVPNYENDIKLYDRLLTSGHMSPFEHIGQAMTELEHYSWRQGLLTNTSQGAIDASAGWCGNFRGFIQHRKLIE